MQFKPIYYKRKKRQTRVLTNCHEMIIFSLMCPEIVKDDGGQHIVFRPNDNLRAGLLDGAPDINLNQDTPPLVFRVFEQSVPGAESDRFIMVLLPTKSGEVAQPAYYRIPSNQWGDYPNPVD